MATYRFKRLLTIVTALFFSLVALAAIFSAFKTVSAVRAVDSLKLAGYNYEIEYLLKDFGLEILDGENNRVGGRTIEYRLTKIDGDVVAENDENYTEATKISIASSEADVKFLCVNAEYTFTITKTADSSVQNFTVSTASSFADAGISFNDDLTSFNNALETYAANLKTGDTFRFNSLGVNASDAATSDYFDINETRVTVYYYAPGVTYVSTASGSKLSEVSFKINTVGEYGFYLIFTDSLDNSNSIDGLVLGNGGYYTDADDDGEYDAAVDTELVVPFFYFTVKTNSNPQVVVGTAEDAFLDLEYSVECFTITAQNYTAVYKLYYIDQANAVKKADYDGEAAYIAAVEEKAKDVTSILDTEEVSFKPTIDSELGTGKGYYYVLLSVYDDNGYSDKVMSGEIACLEEYKEVIPEKQFFKYNVLSIVFLSIAAVSFIAIIVLLFIRPKKKNELEVKE